MAISRQQLAKELEPGLNALFGLEYKNYENQHTEIFDTENSDRAFDCLLYTSPSPRDVEESRMPSSA